MIIAEVGVTPFFIITPLIKDAGISLVFSVSTPMLSVKYWLQLLVILNV